MTPSFDFHPFIVKYSLLAGLLALAASTNVHADGPLMAYPVLPAYKQECGSCHTAYPPSLMPAPSWHRILGNLQHHYGTDASLDAKTVGEIGGWIDRFAGTYKRVREEPPNDRITESAWFIRKHREVPASAWKRPSIRSASNCAACHTRADSGMFSEHEVSIPR